MYIEVNKEKCEKRGMYSGRGDCKKEIKKKRQREQERLRDI